MYTGLIGFILLFVIALIGWGISEAKYKTINFTRSEADLDEQAELDEAAKRNGYQEMNIRDVKKTLCIKGYKAI